MVRTPSVDKTGLKRGAWSQEEDNRLRDYILRYGHWNWRHLPKFAGLARCGKSCRLRWKNYLRPGLKKGSFSKEEEETIIKLREELGNKWSLIAAKVPGRTDNEIKNYWNSRLKKCMKKEAKATEVTIGRSQDMHVMVQKEQDSLISLVESTDQQMDKDPDVAAANVSAKEISFSSYNYSTLAGEAENGFSSEKSFPKFLGSLGTEPVCPRTLHNQSSSSSALGPEDLVSEKGTTLEELFVESFSIKPFSSDASNDLFSPSKDFEPVFSNPSSGQISPSTSGNAAVTNGISLEELFVKSFESFLIEPLSSDSSSSLFSPSKNFEPVFSNASSGLISPSISSNSAVANGNSLEELFVKSFESFSTEPFSSDSSNSLFSPSEDFEPVFSNVSSRLIGSNSTVTNGISLEELFVKSFESFSIEPFSADASNNLFLPSKDFEPVSSNASNGLISPSTNCNSTVTNPEESPADAFCWFRTEPIFSNASDGLISSSTSCNPTVTNSADASSDVFGDFWTETLSLDESIHHLHPPEDGASFSSFLDYDVDLLHQV